MAKMTDYGNSIAGLRRALRSLPKAVKTELTDASREISRDVADDAQGRASSLGGAYARYLGPTIKPQTSSQPGVKMGGKRKLPGRKGDRQTVGDLLFGLEFGGQRRPTTMQFLPHLGNTGYALWPAVRAHSDETGRKYSEALLDALEKV